MKLSQIFLTREELSRYYGGIKEHVWEGFKVSFPFIFLVELFARLKWDAFWIAPLAYVLDEHLAVVLIGTFTSFTLGSWLFWFLFTWQRDASIQLDSWLYRRLENLTKLTSSYMTIALGVLAAMFFVKTGFRHAFQYDILKLMGSLFLGRCVLHSLRYFNSKRNSKERIVLVYICPVLAFLAVAYYWMAACIAFHKP